MANYYHIFHAMCQLFKTENMFHKYVIKILNIFVLGVTQFFPDIDALLMSVFIRKKYHSIQNNFFLFYKHPI